MEIDTRRFRFVLVEPRSGGNVGAAARALKNLGFSRLVVVRPRCDPRGTHAQRMAVDARDLLDTLVVADDLDAALEGAGSVLATSRRTGRRRRPRQRMDRIAPGLVAQSAQSEIAFVFGREDRGLTESELDRATHLVHLLASPDYASLNVAQAVLLCAYELRRASPEGPPEASGVPLATHAEREGLFVHAEQALRGIGFLHDANAVVILRRLRRLVGGAGLASEDVRLLRGLARQILWAAERAS